MTTSWKDYTLRAKFRKTYGKGSEFISVTPEITERIERIVGEWFEARAIYNAEKDELVRLVAEGVITNDLAVSKWFDDSKTKKIELIRKKANDEFKRSLRDLSPKEREKKIAVRNLVRAVYAKAIENVTTTESHWNEAKSIAALVETMQKAKL